MSPIWRIVSAAALWYPSMTGANSSGSSRRASAVEPTTSQQQDAHRRHSALGGMKAADVPTRDCRTSSIALSNRLRSPRRGYAKPNQIRVSQIHGNIEIDGVGEERRGVLTEVQLAQPYFQLCRHSLARLHRKPRDTPSPYGKSVGRQPGDGQGRAGAPLDRKYARL